MTQPPCGEGSKSKHEPSSKLRKVLRGRTVVVCIRDVGSSTTSSATSASSACDSSSSSTSSCSLSSSSFSFVDVVGSVLVKVKIESVL